MLVLYTKQNKLGWEREFKEFGQNLRKFGSSKQEFRFQAVEALMHYKRGISICMYMMYLSAKKQTINRNEL